MIIQISIILLAVAGGVLLLLKLERRRFELSIWRGLPGIMNPGLPLEERLKAIFGLIDKVIKTEEAHLYLADRDSKRLIQKVARGGLSPGDSEGRIFTPSPMERETIELPRAIPYLDRDEVPGLITQGVARFFSLPLISGDGFEGVIRIGPIFSRHTRSLKKNERLLSSLAVPFSLAIKEGLILAEAEKEVAKLKTLSEIERAMLRSAFEIEEFLGLLLGAAITQTKADGGFILVDQKDGKPIRIFRDLPSSIKEEIETIESVDSKLASLNLITHKLDSNGVVALIREDKESFEENSRRLLEAFARQMELALRHANSFQMMLDDYLGALKTLVKTMDARDPLTQEHSERIAHYAGLIAKELGFGDDEIEGIATAAFLHDVGMCGIIDQIIRKPGRYTDYEYETMKNHAQIGAILVEPIKRPIDLAPLIHGHHERYDGWGYPNGLRGKDIPLGARIICLADSFNAKIEKRSYRDPLSLEEAIGQIENASGSQFDPEVIRSFLAAMKRI